MRMLILFLLYRDCGHTLPCTLSLLTVNVLLAGECTRGLKVSCVGEGEAGILGWR
jgi:hypothetical protein